jgi:hypothetical protein
MLRLMNIGMPSIQEKCHSFLRLFPSDLPLSLETLPSILPPRFPVKILSTFLFPKILPKTKNDWRSCHGPRYFGNMPRLLKGKRAKSYFRAKKGGGKMVGMKAF